MTILNRILAKVNLALITRSRLDRLEHIRRSLLSNKPSGLWNIFLLKDWTKSFFHLEYIPEAFSLFVKDYPEIYELAEKYVKGNARNNAGDFTRLYAFILNLAAIGQRNIEGDFAELGVYKGGTACLLAHYAAKQGRELYLFDTFESFDPKDFVGTDADSTQKANYFSDTSVEDVKKLVEHDSICHYFVGYFPDSVEGQLTDKKFAFVSIDCDLYQPMKAGLEFFYPKMSSGGVMFLHDYENGYWPTCKQAIDEFVIAHNLHLLLLPDKSGSAALIIP